MTARDVDPSTLYPEYNLSVPIDHFHNDSKYAPHSNGKFDLRYWFDATYYKPGGPVIILQSGETSGEGRLGFLQKGLLAQLSQATHGIGVVLEHRYYGTSWPVPDLSTKNMRFLTTDQAMADEVYFAKNVVFKGLEKYDLTAGKTPYILYGGSYAGAFVAFLRKLYPDVFWGKIISPKMTNNIDVRKGAISSSGVTEAIWDYWKYYEPHRVYGPPVCISNTQKLTNVLDNILISNKNYTPVLKNAFNLANLT